MVEPALTELKEPMVIFSEIHILANWQVKTGYCETIYPIEIIKSFIFLVQSRGRELILKHLSILSVSTMASGCNTVIVHDGTVKIIIYLLDTFIKHL